MQRYALFRYPPNFPTTFFRTETQTGTQGAGGEHLGERKKITGGKRAAERAGNGGGRHTLLLWRAEGTGRAGETRARGKKTDDNRQKNAPKGNANFPQDVHIFFSSKKNVKRPRKTKALLGTTYHAGNHKNRKSWATEEKYLTHTRNEKGENRTAAGIVHGISHIPAKPHIRPGINTIKKTDGSVVKFCSFPCLSLKKSPSLYKFDATFLMGIKIGKWSGRAWIGKTIYNN